MVVHIHRAFRTAPYSEPRIPSAETRKSLITSAHYVIFERIADGFIFVAALFYLLLPDIPSSFDKQLTLTTTTAMVEVRASEV